MEAFKILTITELKLQQGDKEELLQKVIVLVTVLEIMIKDLEVGPQVQEFEEGQLILYQ